MRTLVGILSLLGWAAAVGQAQIVFDEKLVVIKAKPDDELVVAEFPFTVKGDRPVTILEYDAPCSCLEAKISEGKLTWKPGERGVVKGEFKIASTFKGVVDKNIKLRMREQRLPETLTVRVDIPVLVEIDPPNLFWEVGQPVEPKTIDINIKHEDPIKILKVEQSNENFDLDLARDENTGNYKLTVTPKKAERPEFGLVRIQTDSEFTRHQNYQVFTVVRRPRPATPPGQRRRPPVR